MRPSLLLSCCSELFVCIAAVFVQRDSAVIFKNRTVGILLPVCTDIVHRTGETNTRAVITKNCNPVVAAVLDDGFNEFFVVFFRNGLKLCFRNADIGLFTDFIAGTCFHVLYGQVIVHQDIVLVIFGVQHITPGIDGFNRTVRKCNVEG